MEYSPNVDESADKGTKRGTLRASHTTYKVHVIGNSCRIRENRWNLCHVLDRIVIAAFSESQTLKLSLRPKLALTTIYAYCALELSYETVIPIKIISYIIDRIGYGPIVENSKTTD